jgi:hypothetical protein
MNSQLKEVLIYQGKAIPMDSDPLKQYLDGMKLPPNFIKTLKADQRGYLGKWAVVQNELYLTELNGVLENSDTISLESLFPGKQYVFAEWFTGEIVLNQGRLLALKSSDRPAIYEKDFHLEFSNGRLVKTNIVENTPE